MWWADNMFGKKDWRVWRSAFWDLHFCALPNPKISTMTKPKILHLQMVFHWWHRCAPLQISMTLQHKHMEMGNGWGTSAICIGTWTSEAQILQHVHCSTCNHFRTFDFQYMHVLEQNQHIWNPAGKLPSPLVCLIYYVCIVLPHEPTRGLRKTHVVSQGVWIRTMRNVHCQGFYALVITILSVLHQKLPWK